MTRRGEPLIDQAARDRAVSDLDGSFCVEAGAGTGKTRLLVDRFISIIRSGRAKCSQVAAITFTEKAAGEMKVRLRGEITRLLAGGNLDPVERERLEVARNELERAPISTIHSFAASILREHPLEAAVDPVFDQLDALESALFIEDCWQEFISHISGPYDTLLKRFLSHGGSLDSVYGMALRLYDRRGERSAGGIIGGERLPGAAGKNAQGERGAPEVDEEPLAPGALRGLTALKDTILDRASVLSSLASGHCVNPGDLGYGEIMKFLEEITVMEKLEGEDLEDFLLDVEMPKLNKGSKKNWRPPEKCTEQKKLVGELHALQGACRRSVSDTLRDGLLAWLEGFVGLVDRRKAGMSVLDFDDLLIKARELLRDGGALRSLRRRYPYILVDEFQDTDPLQAGIVLLLAGHAGPPPSGGPGAGRLFIVGDPKQSIYRFRKADVEIYESVKERLSGEGSHLSITQNFRSVPGIVRWVNCTFSRIIQKPGEGRYQPDYEPIDPFRDGPECAVVLLDLEMDGGRARMDESRRAEGEAIARLIRRIVEEGRPVRCAVSKEMRPVTYGDIAVLYPGTTGIDYYEDPLRAEEIPYIVEGGKLYYTRQEVRDLSNSLWAVEDPWDSLSLVAALRSPLFGFSDEEIFLFVRAGGRLNYLGGNIPGDDRFPGFSAAFDLLADLHRNRNERGPAGTLLELLHRTKYMELSLLRPNGEQRVLNIRKAVQNARAFEGRLHSYRRFAGWFREQDIVGTAEGESPIVDESEDAVRLITIHKSKGLQFPVVILANLAQRRTRPSNIILERGRRLAFRLGKVLETSDFAGLKVSEDLKEEAETIRLLYVAATRAGDLLVVPGTPRKGSYFEILEGYLQPSGCPGRIDECPVSGDGAAIGGEASCVMSWKVSDLPPMRGKPKPFVRLPRIRKEAQERALAEKEDWLLARKDLLGLGARHPLVITPTGMEGISGFREGPGGGGPVYEWAGEPVEAPGAPAAAGAGYMTAPGAAASTGPHGGDRTLRFGRAFHRLMELVDLKGAAVPPDLAASIASEYGLAQEAGELEALACRAISSDLLKTASRSSRILREVPFTLPLDSKAGGGGPDCHTAGHFLEGRIDLVFEKEGIWTVVDYKTDDVSADVLDERFKTYRTQGCLYALALDRFGIELKGGIVFYFVRPDETRSLEVSAGLIKRAGDIVRSVIPKG